MYEKYLVDVIWLADKWVKAAKNNSKCRYLNEVVKTVKRRMHLVRLNDTQEKHTKIAIKFGGGKKCCMEEKNAAICAGPRLREQNVRHAEIAINSAEEQNAALVLVCQTAAVVCLSDLGEFELFAERGATEKLDLVYYSVR